ncbi:AI-2 transport protein TqsA [Defluviimonas aquaemixtae]|uniref:AI-2 transport protein TqsA n=1 Tax=Albidovulum aquaemixtae TaxID=1542388 RepID=A0A2R8BJF0_9RHOB|nr:AI-2E family transporter [Defluviimonas aquaemixtae]SPH23477.1 AI-2 transport protein TqsA [Defluviimonas aquaemixtae]
MDTTARLAQHAMIFVGTVALIAALSLASDILAPVALALVAGVVLSPLSDFWEERGFAPFWGALLGLVLTLAVVASLILVFHPIVARLVEQAPKVWSDMREIVTGLRGLLKGLAEVSNELAGSIAPEARANPAVGSGEDAVPLPSVTDALLAAPAVLAQVLVFIGTLFFFLLTRGEIYDWTSLRLSPQGERAELAHRLRRAERSVSRYFLTITLINAGLGIVTALVLRLIGLEDAMMWGAVAFMVNFVLYLGPAVFAVVLIFVGVAEFDGIRAIAPAAAFLLLNATEGQFVTPALVGRRMAINPLLVFLSLVSGLWLWGPVGGIVAIPLLLWVLVLNDAIGAPLERPVESETA